MKSVGEYHQHAMEKADQALEARRRGDESAARAFFREAFLSERTAAQMVAQDLTAEPTRSVLHRSAASLGVECGEAREAERLIATALSGDPPAEIAAELRELWQTVCHDLSRVPAAAAG
jgi:hypothetical protein